MILQALNRYYEILAADPECDIPRLGFSTEKISFCLVISAQGEIVALLPLTRKVQRGKKEIELSHIPLIVPERVPRSVNIDANYLWDNAEYILGLSGKEIKGGKESQEAAKRQRRFQVFREKNLSQLEKVNAAESRALAAFLTRYTQEMLIQHPSMVANLEALKQGGNLVFKLEGSDHYLHESPELQQEWIAHKLGEAQQADLIQCLITGETAPLATLHNQLQGVKGTQSTGAALVGFNASAYQSYNSEQGRIAPTGKTAAYQYYTALKYLLSPDCPNPKFQIGDTTVVYWAMSSSPAYAELYHSVFDPDWAGETPQEGRDSTANDRLRAVADKVKRGEKLDGQGLLEGLNPNMQFFVLGLAPNAARISVRFFYQDTFLNLIEHLLAHYEDLAIEREYENQPARLPPYTLLRETYSQNAQVKEPPPLLGGALMRAILGNTPYPALLYNTVINRVRADADNKEKHIYKINYSRAAIIKACLIRKYRNLNQPQIKEVLCMSLNEQSTNQAYLMGRLFAVLEKAQLDALGENINSTIKDRYFSSACASPATVFPILLRLSQHHISKAEFGYVSENLIQSILNLLEIERNPFPTHLGLDEQGLFILGYYHQRAVRYQSKAKKAELAAQASEA